MAVVRKVDQKLKSIPQELYSNQNIYINIGEINFNNNEFEEIPQSLTIFCSLKKISFNGNKINQINDVISKISTLESLVLNQNIIENIHESITTLSLLTNIELSTNKIKEFNLNILTQRLDLSVNFLSHLTLDITTLTFLDVSQNDLSTFPVLNCPNIKQINASYNNIKILPDTITILSNLRYLDISNNLLTSFPRNFSLLSSLTLLYIQNNPISNTPPNFHTMKLRKYNCSYCQNLNIDPITSLKELIYVGVGIDNIFEDLSVLKNLETIDLSKNLLKNIHCSSTNLFHLDVSNNIITSITFGEKNTINKLFAKNNQLCYIDSSIALNSKIITCDLSNNKIKIFPNKIELIKLQYLNISFNLLNSIDTDYSKLLSLQFLDISFNKLNNISPQISFLTNLNYFCCSGNLLNSLPQELSNLINLTNLYCSSNNFTSFPQVILSLTQLKKLYISSNKIQNIPCLSTLNKIQTLDLSDCYLININNIINLSNLEQLNLSYNYLTSTHSFNGCTSLLYIDLSYNSIQEIFDLSQFDKYIVIDYSFNDISIIPPHNSNINIRYDGCNYIQKFSILNRFIDQLKFKPTPTICGSIQMCAERNEMQDSIICIPNFAAPEHYLFAAVDGHSGYSVPNIFSKRFPEIFYDLLQFNNCILSIEDALFKSFDTIQNEFSNLNISDVGAVATVVFMTPTHIYTAQCGDCRAVYITSHGIIQLAPEHKTTDRNEQIRIRSEGGFVDSSSRVCGLLVARSLGDCKNKPIITHIPDITCTKRRENEEFLVIATDGLWDEVSNQKIHEILHSRRSIYRTSELLTLLKDTAYVSCIANQLPDNIAIVLCRL